jgi:hypothetical protein
MNLVELNKADRLGLPPGPLRAWITFFKHWQNVVTDTEVALRALAETIAWVVGYQGELRFDLSKLDGPPRKWLDVSRLSALGWRARYPHHHNAIRL